MNNATYKMMAEFVDSYLRYVPALIVYDVGARDVNGCYRPLFQRPGWTYVGLDIVPGRNVDLVVAAYQFKVPTGIADVVITGQTLEHVEQFWVWVKELARICVPGGLIAISAPYEWRRHPAPVDCWRILPDGMAVLATLMGCDLLECTMRESHTFGVFEKRKGGPA